MVAVVAVADLTVTLVDGTDPHVGLTISHRHPTGMDICMVLQTAPRRTGCRIRLAHPRTRNSRGNLTLHLSLDLVVPVRMGGRLLKAMEVTSEVVLGVVLLEVAHREVVRMVALPEAEVHQGGVLRGMADLVMDNMVINLRPMGEGDTMVDTAVPVEEDTGAAVVDTAGMVVMAASQVTAAMAHTRTDHQVVAGMVTPGAVVVVMDVAVPILREVEVVVAGSVHVNLSPLTNELHI